MNPTIKIRPGTVEDILHIKRIAEDTWPVAYKGILSDAQLAYMLDLFYNPAAIGHAMNSGQNFLLAYRSEDMVPQGFVAAGVADDTGDAWKLHKLYVTPFTQGSGSGIALLRAAEKLAVADGAKSIILNVNRFNPSIAFYTRYGYSKSAEVDVAIGNGYFMNDFIMKKALIVSTE